MELSATQTTKRTAIVAFAVPLATAATCIAYGVYTAFLRPDFNADCEAQYHSVSPIAIPIFAAALVLAGATFRVLRDRLMLASAAATILIVLGAGAADLFAHEVTRTKWLVANCHGDQPISTSTF